MDCGWWNSPGSDRPPSPGCSWPISAPTSSASTGPPRPDRPPAGSRPVAARASLVLVDLKNPGAPGSRSTSSSRQTSSSRASPGVAERLGLGPEACRPDVPHSSTDG